MLGRYVLLGTLGKGGMGTVLEAFDRTLDRRVAVKVLHRDLGERHTTRLMREAQAMAKLSHPNVVQVYEVGEVEGRAFVAMELVRGQTPREWLQQQPRPDWRACVEMFISLGAGLSAAHARGLVHRDFKPRNAIIDEEGRPRLLDFGLARQADTEDDASNTLLPVGARVDTDALDTPLTRTGAVLGTPAYMSPEQIKGHEADARSDQFSFCVSLYEAVYGERPFAGRGMKALLMAMAAGQIRPAPRESRVPTALRTVLLRGLSFEPERRWPSMEALLAALRKLVAPRRRRGLALGVVTGLIAIAGGLAYQAEVSREAARARGAALDRRCSGARAELDGIWDDTRRSQIQAAILGTGSWAAPDTWARVGAHLDAYADAWTDAHTAVCEATTVRGEQSPEVMDRRMGCLNMRKVALRETVKVLARVDAERIDRAMTVVTDLPSLLRCDDVEALRAQLPPPEDPQVAAQVNMAREQLAEARALLAGGDYARSRQRAGQVLEQARQLGYGPLEAEALLVRGEVHSMHDDYAEAEDDLRQAYLLALRYEHRGVELRAVSSLTYVTSSGRAQPEHAEPWVDITRALADRRGIDDEQRAVALREVGGALAQQGRWSEALELYRAALALLEQALGPRRPEVGRMLNRLGDILRKHGHLEQAEQHHRRALDLFEDVLGPRHPSVAYSLRCIGRVLHLRGDSERALNALQRALALDQELLGPEHVSVAGSLHSIGEVLLHKGALDDALVYLQRGLAMRAQAVGPEHPLVGQSQIGLGRAWARRGDETKARQSLERGLEILEGALGPEHPDIAHARVARAELALAGGRIAGAREQAERAVSVCEANGVASMVLAQARFVLARALWTEPSERARAVALAQQAQEAYAGYGPGRRDDRVAIEAWLATHTPRSEAPRGAPRTTTR
ncbi:MAG: tetratricopeptide repeat protein [Myxococcota bacterium]